jgi:hypothetical protein
MVRLGEDFRPFSAAVADKLEASFQSHLATHQLLGSGAGDAQPVWVGVGDGREVDVVSMKQRAVGEHWRTR